MTIKIYLSNLARYIEGNENGKFLTLPMGKEALKKVFTEIVGDGNEWIILDYNAPFHIGEYEDIFKLNELLQNVNECGINADMLEALYKVGDNKEETTEKIIDGRYDIINVDAVSSGWCTSLNREEVFGAVTE